MTARRLKGKGRVQHDHPVRFQFDGKTRRGLLGDSLASALMADDVLLLGRSFKYHRPRGVLAAGSEEPNALVGAGRSPETMTPNERATMVEIHPRLIAESQNRWPSLTFDIGAVNDALAPVFAAGFYYKTFKWPASWWTRIYEPVIRAAAGLGRAPSAPDPDHYSARCAHAEVLVVGAGVAGISAALTASEDSDSRVILCDEHAEMGGWLLSAPETEVDGKPAWDWLASALNTLESRANVTLLPRTTAIALLHQNYVTLSQRLTDHLETPPEGAPRERMWKLRAGRVILTQGALERPLLFAGNDRPGVLLAGAARTYLERFGVLVGEAPALVTSHDWGWEALFRLAEAGARPAAIIDPRCEVPARLTARAAKLGIETLLGWTVTATQGRKRIEALTAAPAAGGQARRIACDALLMSGGWTPSLHLASHAGIRPVWDAGREVFLPGDMPGEIAIAGAAAGAEGLAEAAAQGRAAAGAEVDIPQADAPTGGLIRELPGTPANARAFVDFQNDVTAKDLRLAVREGMRSIEHVKRYTTTGMATDQGKTSNINALGVAAQALDRPAPQVGLTTFRPPYTPTTFGAFAGHEKGALFQPTRRTPIDGWAEDQGAVFENVGPWRRARYFPQPGEGMRAATARECAAVRQRLGLFDASTLGKIEAVGPDAQEFLNRLYTNPLAKLEVGKARYALMLGEDGFIRDDGIVARIGEDRFHVTTTTTGAPAVLAKMEDYLQTEWPELKVWLTSTTERWGVIALQGPRARDLLAPFVEGLDITNDAFPHMSVAECRVCGVKARLFRVSFTGELGYEVNVPAHRTLEVWEALHEAAKRYDAATYGTETMHILRAEKGYLIVGQDTDGTATPEDMGYGWAVGRKKPDFVGKRGLARRDLTDPRRRQLVGLLTEDPNHVLEEGAQLVADPTHAKPIPMLGHVTSSYWSEALGRSIALAMVTEGRDLMGATLHAPLPGGDITARVVAPVFYDAEGGRLHV